MEMGRNLVSRLEAMEFRIRFWSRRELRREGGQECLEGAHTCLEIRSLGIRAEHGVPTGEDPEKLLFVALPQRLLHLGF